MSTTITLAQAVEAAKTKPAYKVCRSARVSQSLALTLLSEINRLPISLWLTSVARKSNYTYLLLCKPSHLPVLKFLKFLTDLHVDLW